jgi:tetratricopeptide (TPR) repeat protein
MSSELATPGMATQGRSLKHGLSLLVIFLLTGLSVFAQNERKVIRQGVKDYQDGKFSEAEVQFRKASDLNRESFEAGFNTGAAMYNQEKYEETVKQYEQVVGQSEDPETLAKVWHNIGNSFLEAGQYEPSMEAYKNSLRNNPADADTKYNLAYARQKLQEQQQQQNQNQNQDQQDQENQEQQEQQEQENQDQQEQQEQENQDQQEQQEQENQDQPEQQNQEQQEQQNQEQQEQQARPLEISKEDAERMLNAIQQQEKDVKEKVDKKKAAAAKVKTEKDW